MKKAQENNEFNHDVELKVDLGKALGGTAR